MTGTPAAVKNGSLNAEHLGSKVVIDGGRNWMIQGELCAVRHGATDRSEGIPMVTITIKISKSISVPYDQYIAVVLQTEGYNVTVWDTEREWKG